MKCECHCSKRKEANKIIQVNVSQNVNKHDGPVTRRFHNWLALSQ